VTDFSVTYFFVNTSIVQPTNPIIAITIPNKKTNIKIIGIKAITNKIDTVITTK
jgi:hypothetical protein